MVTEFHIHKFSEFIVLLSDFQESLDMWKKESSHNTWDMNVLIGEGIYIIEIEINESTDKSK